MIMVLTLINGGVLIGDITLDEELGIYTVVNSMWIDSIETPAMFGTKMEHVTLFGRTHTIQISDQHVLFMYAPCDELEQYYNSAYKFSERTILPRIREELQTTTEQINQRTKGVDLDVDSVFAQSQFKDYN